MTARFTDHFVTVSKADRNRGIEMGLFSPETSSVIRAAIDLDRFRGCAGGEATRQRLGIPAGVPVITQIGNFKPQKAPLDFVRVAAAVHAKHPEARFVMVGDGPLRSAAEGLARELGVAKNLIMTGWWDDVPGLLAATTVSVLTSLHEGLPCSVVESLTAGVPVVATAVDGTVEVVRSRHNGLLAAAGDVAGLAEAVSQLVADPELRERLGTAGRQGLDDFDLEFMVKQQEDLYRWVVSSSRS
jgi:glycosyltransferase involved in cell wall biosynthesis